MQLSTSSIYIANQSPFCGLFHCLQGVSVVSLVFLLICFAVPSNPRLSGGEYSYAYAHPRKLQK